MKIEINELFNHWDKNWFNFSVFEIHYENGVYGKFITIIICNFAIHFIFGE